MNNKLLPFAKTKTTPGFIKGFIGDDLIYELVMAYLSDGTDLYMVISDDTKRDEVDVVALLSETIYKEGSEIIEICDDDDGLSALIYRCDDGDVAFLMRMNFTVAIWAA